MNESESPALSGGRDDLGSLIRSAGSFLEEKRQSQSKKINIEIHIAKPNPDSEDTPGQAGQGSKPNPIQSQLFPASLPRSSFQHTVHNQNVRYENQRSFDGGSHRFLVEGEGLGVLASADKIRPGGGPLSQSQAKLTGKRRKDMLSASPDFGAVNKGAGHLRRSPAQSAAKVTKVVIASDSDHNLAGAGEVAALERTPEADTA